MAVTQAQRQARYESTEKGASTMKRYRTSAKGKLTRLRRHIRDVAARNERMANG